MTFTPTPPDEPQGLEPCPRCEQGRIGEAKLTCLLCFGAGMVQPWVASQERTQQESWARYLAGRERVPDGAHPELGKCAQCWPTRCPQCPWMPPPLDEGPDGLRLAA